MSTTVHATPTASPGGDALAQFGLRVPSDWAELSQQCERHDERAVLVTRHQPRPGLRLGGPHITVVTDASDATLLGYTRLHEPDGPIPKGVPTPEHAGAVAVEFLRRIDEDHAAGLTLQWIANHDEVITLQDRSKISVGGMKVKNRHDGGLYTWVIVGPGGRVLTYERAIAWNVAEGRRSTEMWLHDRWISAYRGAGPQPSAPYALVRPASLQTDTQIQETA